MEKSVKCEKMEGRALPLYLTASDLSYFRTLLVLLQQ